VTDGNGGGHKGNVTAGVTELSNGKEGLHGKVGNDMSMSGRRWKSGDIEVGFMGGMEYDARRGVNCDRGGGRALIAHRHGRRKEMRAAA